MQIPPPEKARRVGGFTLAELMVAIFLSILVITALYSVFSRVQEMFRFGHNQTLVLERGRAIMDMMVRDLEMMQAASLPNTENLNARDYGVEFHELDKLYNAGNIVFKENERAYFAAPNLTTRIGNDDYKTYLPPDLLFFDEPPPSAAGNKDGKIHKKTEVPKEYWVMFDQFDRNKDGFIDPSEAAGLPESESFYSGDFSFLGFNRDWHLFGYGLYSTKGARIPNPLVGSLYRYNQSWKMEYSDIPSEIGFLKSRQSRGYYQKVADGVVHLRLRAVMPDSGRALWQQPIVKGGHLPIYVEVEMGLLEDTVVRELAARREEHNPATPYVDFYNSQLAFITDNMDKLHLFRQLVPIRNARYFGINDAEIHTMEMKAFREMGLNLSLGKKHIFFIDNTASMGLENRREDVIKALKSTDKRLENWNKGKADAHKKILYPKPFTNHPFNTIDQTLNEWGQDLSNTTIWLLSDARKIDKPGSSVADRLIRATAPHRARVNTIGIGRNPADLDPVLKSIAEETGGTYTFIRPDISINRER